jgi:hypothetical protein
VSGAGDRAPLAAAVDRVREWAGRFPDSDESREARRARRLLAAVEAWEARRRRRCVRLWTAVVEVRATAVDAGDARYRLSGRLHRPCHRTGETAVLVTTEEPGPCPLGMAGHAAGYSRRAWRHRHDRSAFGEWERAHVDAYVRALLAGQARVTSRAGGGTEPVPVACGPVPLDGELGLWRVRHRVLFLAGPGESGVRAAELAATVVDHAGRRLARVVGLEPDDEHSTDGSSLHPACVLGASRIAALWDDYDAAEHDAGDAAALATVLGAAAERLRSSFAAAARRHGLRPVPET